MQRTATTKVKVAIVVNRHQVLVVAVVEVVEVVLILLVVLYSFAATAVEQDIWV